MSTVKSILRPLSILLLLSALRNTEGQRVRVDINICVFTGSRDSDSKNYIYFIGSQARSLSLQRIDLKKHDDAKNNSRDCYTLLHDNPGELTIVYLKRSHIGKDRDWKVKKIIVQYRNKKFTCKNNGETTVNETPVGFPCKPGIKPSDISSAPPLHGSSVLVLMTMCTMPILLNSLL